MKLHRLVFVFAAFFMFLSLAGCFGGNNTVQLVYDRSGASVVPASTAPRVVVVLFEDRRGRIDIGVHKDGSPFNPASSVAEWASQGFADELARQGAQVSLAGSMQQAQAGNPQYIVTGRVEHVWLTEKNISSCSCVVRVQTSVHSAGGHVQTKTFSSQVDKAGIPGNRLFEVTLSETLAESLSSAASSFMNSI